MMKAVQFTKYGGPDVLGLVDAAVPQIGEKEVLIDVKAIGVNYADTARREGQYVVPTPLPFVPGAEIAGIVTEVGKGVQGVEKGKRVVTLIEQGGYAEYAVAPAKGLIPIPDGVDFEEAVALPLQGLTAYHTLKTMGRLTQGETVLIHAAAGGVGLLAVQLAKLFGAGQVIATASSDSKLALAEEMGADHLVNYTESGWSQKVLDLTNGEGVDVALEMVGGDVFHKSLDCLATFGRLVIYGAASGEQAQFYPATLMERSQSVIGFFLPQIIQHRPELLESSLEELLGYVKFGELKLKVWGSYPLTDAALVHQLLQGRETTGKVILTP